MAEQYRVNDPESVNRKCRPFPLLQHDAGRFISPRLIKGRIGEQAQPEEFNKNGRAANQREAGF